MTDNASPLSGGKTDAQILADVYALLEDRSRWCQEAYALDLKGNLVRPADPSAAAWSIEGALGLCSNEFGIPPPHLRYYLDEKVLEYMNQPGPPSILVDWDVGWFNDYATHDTVMDFLQGVLTCVRS